MTLGPRLRAILKKRIFLAGMTGFFGAFSFNGRLDFSGVTRQGAHRGGARLHCPGNCLQSWAMLRICYANASAASGALQPPERLTWWVSQALPNPHNRNKTP